MEDDHEHNETFDLDENLVPIEVEKGESLHSHDLDMNDLNDEGDGNDEVEYEFNFKDRLLFSQCFVTSKDLLLLLS